MNFGIGYDREYEMQEIAEALGFTSERIRQVKKSALEKMKNAYVKELNK
jgi:DNA-directed RNA polymerase sigma subunit (sigma70/sigma32)